MHQTLFPEILKDYGDRVTFVYKDYPVVGIHPWAVHAAVDANCLASQNDNAYWDFADYVHAEQHQVNNEKTLEARMEQLDRITILQAQKHSVDVSKVQACVKTQDEREVWASMKQAESVGVEATPALFVNGEEIPGGAVPPNVVRAAIDRALREVNLPAPPHAVLPEPSKSKSR